MTDKGTEDTERDALPKRSVSTIGVFNGGLWGSFVSDPYSCYLSMACVSLFILKMFSA